MSRGLLDDPTLLAITQQLPNLDVVQNKVLKLNPSLIAVKFGPNSNIPTAAVCLQDSSHTLSDARYALHEALAHETWYLNVREVKSEIAATYFARYYLDDVSLRLYSAAEHLSEAIVCLLEIQNTDLHPYRVKLTSRQSILGSYLREKLPSHQITSEILKLANSSEWKATIRYRNDCVHAQPPLVSGLGVAYIRKQRWKTLDDGKSYQLGFGGGDEPKYAISDLYNFIKPSLFLFANTLGIVVDLYVNLLEQNGFSQNTSDNNLSLKII